MAIKHICDICESDKNIRELVLLTRTPSDLESCYKYYDICEEHWIEIIWETLVSMVPDKMKRDQKALSIIEDKIRNRIK